MKKVPLMKFGLIGRIVLDCNRSSSTFDADQLLHCFDHLEDSVAVIWHGKYLVGVSVQHPEDARQSPGVYRAVPLLAPDVEGVVYGQFFNNSHPRENEQIPFPVAVSSKWGRLYIEQGIRAFSNLNGAWVAVFWDNLRQRLVAVRDEVGIETMYVRRNSDTIFFATDLRWFRCGDLPLAIDEQAMAEFLHFLYVPSPRTIYKGVESVLPGHVLTMDGGRIVQQPFAASRFYVGHSISDRKELDALLASKLSSFQECLFDAVRDSLPTSGRVGLLLSGGKDSSALAVALKHLAGSRTVAITIGSVNNRLDESLYASQIARFLGIEHHIYIPSDDDLITSAEKWIPTLGQPIADPAVIPLMAVLPCLPDDISVIFDGTGNDYYFGIVRPLGRQIYKWRCVLDRWIPKFVKPVVLDMIARGPSRLRHFAHAWRRPIEESFVSWSGWTNDELNRLFGRKISFDDTYMWQTMRQQSSQGWLSLQTQIICGIWEPHAAYAKVVCAAREAGRAVRFPFVDNRLARFVNELPQPFQFKGDTNKVLLRAFLSKHLPSELLSRPKGSFVVERTRLLEYGNRTWVRSLEKDNQSALFIDWSEKEIETLIRRYEKRPREYADRLYAVCLLSMWLNRYVADSKVEDEDQ